MKKIRVFQHIDGEGPGRLADILDAHGTGMEVLRPDRGERVPAGLDWVSGLVFLGGPMSVNDPLPFIADECSLIREAVGRDVPVLGICLGGQLVAKALGATVGPNPVPEIGWFDVERVDGPAADTWLAGLPARFGMLHWHGETFTLPPRAECFLSSAACPNQAFASGSALALQCHPEVDGKSLDDWARYLERHPVAPSPTVNTPAQLLEDAPARLAELGRVAETILGRWVASL